jgi:hypothetical protein
MIVSEKNSKLSDVFGMYSSSDMSTLLFMIKRVKSCNVFGIYRSGNQRSTVTVIMLQPGDMLEEWQGEGEAWMSCALIASVGEQ